MGFSRMPLRIAAWLFNKVLLVAEVCCSEGIDLPHLELTFLLLYLNFDWIGDWAMNSADSFYIIIVFDLKAEGRVAI